MVMVRPASAIFGIPIDLMTMPETIHAIFAMVDSYVHDHTPRYVATLNVDFLNQTHGWGWNSVRNPELLSALRRADLVTADGMPLLWCSAALGCPIPARVTGADLVPAIAEEACKRRKSLYLLGGRPQTALQASERLKIDNPRLQIVGISTPEVALHASYNEEMSLIEEINDTKPDILLINLGNPKQELWFSRNRHSLRVPVSIGVGGALGFLSKDVKRAPMAMQRLGLEWTYRLAQEPQRLWKRYSIDALKIASLLTPLWFYHSWSKLTSDDKKSSLPILTTIQENGIASAVIVMPPLLTDQKGNIANIFSKSLTHNNICLDFALTQHIDPRGMAQLIILIVQAQEKHIPFFATGISPHLQQLFILHRVWDLLSSKSVLKKLDMV